MNTSQELAIFGLILCLLGTFFVAIELVIRFNGYAYEIKTMTYDGQGNPVPTAEYSRWELRRAKFMWFGLALITIGTGLQVASICATQ